MADDPDGDDFLFERLQQSASGDAAVRQLRRRYDLLRRDYEHLLDRLGDIEDRLTAETPRAAPPAPQPNPPAEQEPAAAGLQEQRSVSDGLVGPLLKLRDEYLSAVTGIQSIVSGLDGLAAAALKGQHAPAPATEPAATSSQQPEPESSRVQGEPEQLQVDVKGPGFAALLDFEERLSRVEGVSRVAIKAIDNERATLIVELTRDNGRL